MYSHAPDGSAASGISRRMVFLDDHNTQQHQLGQAGGSSNKLSCLSQHGYSKYSASHLDDSNKENVCPRLSASQYALSHGSLDRVDQRLGDYNSCLFKEPYSATKGNKCVVLMLTYFILCYSGEFCVNFLIITRLNYQLRPV